MKKVLQISNYIYPHIGGIEQTARDIANVLAEERIEQKIICFNENAEDNDHVCHRNQTVNETLDNVDVIRCGCIAKISSQSISLTYKNELKKVIKSFEPDIIIFHYPNPFVASILLPLLRKNKNIKLVLYWHLDITKQKILGKLFNRQSHALLKRANKIVATSPNYIDGSKFLSCYKCKCVAISSPIRSDRLKITDETKIKAEKIKNKYKDKTICFAIGRHVPYKGFTYLIQASKYLNNDYKIIIGGKGPLTEQLKSEAKDNDIIKFCGRLSDEDLAAHYMACDIFCFPSITKNEAYGLSLAEAMFFGKPAVTFNIPGSGVNFVSLNKVTGIECQNRNVKEYAEAIKTLTNDKKLAIEYGENAKKRVVDNFMFDTFKKKINRLVNDL